MNKKKILVACGTGSVTSQNIAMKIEKYLKGKGIDCTTDTCRVIDLREKIEAVKPDLVASATKLPELDVPTIVATALLTGVGTEKIYNEIYEILTR